MPTHIPKPSVLLGHGTIDRYYEEIGAIVARFNSNPRLKGDFRCGYWGLYKYKCRMNNDRECWVGIDERRKEVARGRISEEGLEGLARLTPDWEMERMGEPEPKTRYRVTWILGGGPRPIEYDLERYDGWRCGDDHQPPNKLPDGQIDPDDRTNEYQFWFIRLYDHTGKYPYEPFMFDDPKSPDPTPPRCRIAEEPPPPVEYTVTCGCGECENEDGSGEYVMGVTTNPEEAVRLWAQCQSIVENDEDFRTRCACDEAPPIIRPPIIRPPRPTPDEPPETAWGAGEHVIWNRPPGGVPWTFPSPSSPGTSESTDGGAVGSPGGPGAGPGGPVFIPPPIPPRLPICLITVRPKCPPTNWEDLRTIGPDIEVPLKGQIIEVAEENMKGLEDATYYTEHF